jgi:hypothetical protein
MTLTRSLVAALAAIAAGAAAMYYLDPQSGRRRRALARDRVDAVRHDVVQYTTAKSRRAADRARGLVAGVRSRLTPAGPVDDGQVEGRVRAHLGRVLAYPKAVHTTVEHGCVRLEGHVLERDLDPLLSEVKSVPGVHRILNRLTVHQDAEDNPALQIAHAADVPVRQRRYTRPVLSALAIAAPLALAVGAARRNGALRAMR